MLKKSIIAIAILAVLAVTAIADVFPEPWPFTYTPEPLGPPIPLNMQIQMAATVDVPAGEIMVTETAPGSGVYQGCTPYTVTANFDMILNAIVNDVGGPPVGDWEFGLGFGTGWNNPANVIAGIHTQDLCVQLTNVDMSGRAYLASAPQTVAEVQLTIMPQ